MARVADRRVVVTGAGAGIGREIAMVFAAEGAHVGVTDVDESTAAAVAGEIRGQGGVAHSHYVDVANHQSINTMMEAMAQALGGLDILVNNAGIGLTKSFLATSLDEWNRVLQVNLTGTFLCSQAAARIMIARGRGRIINLASISGERGGTGRAAYGASKAGVILLTKVMAVELAAKGVIVNAISPGPTETEQVRQCHDDATRDAYHRLLPLARYAEPREIAAAALFLASDESGFVAGHILNVDGGFGAAGLIFPLD